MRNIYLTSTFRHEWNRNFNPLIGQVLLETGFSCHLPKMYEPEKETEGDVFKRDIDGINDAEVVLAIAENESPNWGAEVGYAYGIKKPIIALADKNHQIPLVLNGMITEVVCVEDLNEVGAYIGKLSLVIRNYLRQ